MRKRRRLANKLTIMVCAVLCAVSAFFYAPMEVSASSDVIFASGSSSVSTSISAGSQVVGVARFTNKELILDNISNLESDKYYLISYSGSSIFSTSSKLTQSSHCVNLDFAGLELCLVNSTTYHSNINSYTYDFSGSFVYYAVDDPTFTYDSITYCSATPSFFTGRETLTFNIDSVEQLQMSDGESYQNGYNSGYSDGESAGYGNGYSQGFADGEASVDTDEIYDEAFQAGKDSVDTQSYYDAGYQAGYDAAYSAGYESGYDVGYQSAMDRIDSWGADTSEYPKLVNSGTFNDIRLDGALVSENQTLVYDDYMVKFTNNFNPFHVYKVVVNVSDVNFFSGPDGNYREDYVPNYIGYLTVLLGSNTYKLDTLNSWIAEYYISGEEMSNLFTLRSNWNTSAWHDSDNGAYPLGYAYCEISEFVVELYDMGPAGNTQNHIANQTDQLTNGFDESQGNSVNSDLSTGLNEYQTAEDSLWATATTGLKDFTFFDFESVPAMITGMSFITSIMGSWFSHTGGASGVGIVLSILFSVMLVAMVLGLYRLYQSKGGKK